MFLRNTILAFALLAGTFLFGQQEIMMSQYMFNRLFLNPAYAGMNDHFTSTLLHRDQWSRFEGAPSSSLLGADGSLKKGKIGVGATILHDKIGASKDLEIAGQFAYHLNLNERDRLSFGMKAGMSIYSATLVGLTVWDETDPVFQSNIYNTTLGKFGVGAMWTRDHTYIGVSVPTLFAKKDAIAARVAGNDGNLFDQHYYVNAGHLIRLNENFDFKPTTLIKYKKNAPVDIDLNANILFKQMLWFGVGWRTGDAVVVMLDYKVMPELRFGYAYDMTTSALSGHTGGSHELMIGFDMAKDEVKLKNPRYF